MQTTASDSSQVFMNQQVVKRRKGGWLRARAGRLQSQLGRGEGRTPSCSGNLDMQSGQGEAGCSAKVNRAWGRVTGLRSRRPAPLRKEQLGLDH